MNQMRRQIMREFMPMKMELLFYVLRTVVQINMKILSTT